jgi:protein NirF
MEIEPRGAEIWISVRDQNLVKVYDTASFELKQELAVDAPSGIFFTNRAHKIGL